MRNVPPKDLEAFIMALHERPIPVGMWATKAFYSYSSGILEQKDVCKYVPKNWSNHGVLAVGYELDPNTQSMWILFKNSWGTDWGD